MEILGVGPAELAFIILIALILLGPKDMIAAGRTIGKVLRQFLTSPTWQAIRQTGQEIQNLPTKLAREAGLEELEAAQKSMEKEIRGVTQDVKEQIRIPEFGKKTDSGAPGSGLKSDPYPAAPLNQPEPPSETPAAPGA